MRIFVSILFACIEITAQTSFIPSKKNYSFGKFWYLNRKGKFSSLNAINSRYLKDGIVYDKGIFYQEYESYSYIKSQYIFHAKELNNIYI